MDKQMNEKMTKTWNTALRILNPTEKELEHGLKLHENSLVIDTYGFGPAGIYEPEPANAAVKAGASEIELQNLHEDMIMTGYVKNPEHQKEYKLAWDVSGVNCIFRNAGQEGQAPLRLMKRLANFVYVTDMMRNFVPKVAVPDDIVRAAGKNGHCICLTCNGIPISEQWVSVEEEMQYIKYFFYFGSRMMHLTYNRRNMLGDGCAEPANAGLSDFGRTVIKEMNRLGIIVDVAHSGWKTSLEAAQASEQPIFASHTVCAGINPHCRAKPDEVIRAIVDKQGLIGICCISNFLGRTGDITALLDHIDYVVKNFGVDYAAIGTDVGYSLQLQDNISEKFIEGRKTRQPWRSFWPKEVIESFKHKVPDRVESLAWTNWPLFTTGLVQRGYSDKDIQKIIGGNALRVARQVFESGYKGL